MSIYMPFRKRARWRKLRVPQHWACVGLKRAIDIPAMAQENFHHIKGTALERRSDGLGGDAASHFFQHEGDHLWLPCFGSKIKNPMDDIPVEGWSSLALHKSKLLGQSWDIPFIFLVPVRVAVSVVLGTPLVKGI